MCRFSALILVVAVATGACGADDAGHINTVNPTTVASTSPPTTRITTTAPPASTTTTIAQADIKVEIGVYDGWIRTSWDYCLTRDFEDVDFLWIGRDARVLMKDAISNELVAVAELGPGQVEQDTYGHEHCVFHGTFHDVPLDRTRYAYVVEGDHWGAEVTVEAAELDDRKVSTVYFEPGEQAKREEARSN